MTLEKPDGIHEQLINILKHDRVGEIQGVRFDLQHPALDPEIYHAPDLIHQFYFMGLRYPWDEDAPAPEDKLVNIGDRVFFHKVDRLNRGAGPLTDPHDAYEFWAYVGIERASGQIDILDEPAYYVPIDAMGPYSDYESIDRDEDFVPFIEHHKITFKKIAFRIDRLIKSEKLTGEKGEWLRLADDMLTQSVDEAEAVNESLKGEAEALIDLVATAAYALASAESAVRVAPLAKKALKAMQTRMAATEAARNANMKADTPDLLQAAKAMCGVDPNLSLTTCAKRLGERFGRDPRNVRQTIKHLFEPRPLSSGHLEYRPKRKKGETGGVTG